MSWLECVQKWEEYNASLRSTATASTTAPSGATAAAAAALRCWSAISKPARQALRKANVHSVLALETQLLDLLEQVRVCGVGRDVDGCRQPQAQEQHRQGNCSSFVLQVLCLGVSGWQAGSEQLLWLFRTG